MGSKEVPIGHSNIKSSKGNDKTSKGEQNEETRNIET